MWLEAGCGGNQSADSGRDAHGHHQDVIDNQRRGRQQRDILPQIFARDRIRAAAARISRDGLKIGNIDDDQQRDNAEADGYDVLNAESAQRDQQRECGFRTVTRGAQRIQAEDSDARHRAEAFFSVLMRREMLAK